MQPGLFHLTLCMIRIEGEEGIREAQQMMTELEREFSKNLKLSQSSFTIKGLATFGQRVLYAKVNPTPKDIFSDMYLTIQNRLRLANNIWSTNKFESIPHMTIVKVNRPIARVRRSKYLPSSLYADFEDCSFGVQPVNNIKLCVIDAETHSDGFYRTIGEIEIS